MAKIEILKVGHALVAGKRGEKGGAPSKDSIWGVAFVQGNLVKFFGRRGGVLRYKTERKSDLADTLAMFADKLAGKGRDYKYTEVAPAKYNDLMPDFEATVAKGYYAAMRSKKLNTRATARSAGKKQKEPAQAAA